MNVYQYLLCGCQEKEKRKGDQYFLTYRRFGFFGALHTLL